MTNKCILNATSPLATWLNYIEKLHTKPIDMGLNRVSKVAERLAIIKPAPFIFIVAGTNGKGTTCCTLEAILIEEGYKVGVYSSPHLVRYVERVRIQNSELKESAHTASFAEIEAVRRDISLTYFEYSTLSALWLFKQEKVDIVILEVGLGGRLDATNIVDADVAIITSIALDHTELLGPDRNSIGWEKAGIFRSYKPAIVGELNIPQTIAQVADQKRARLLRRNIDWSFALTANSWQFNDAKGQLNILPMPNVPISNSATAIAALRASGLVINEESIKKGIINAILPGRFQIVKKSPRLILDVAHNPHSAAYLAKKIKLLPQLGRVLAVIGMYKDKDIAATLACMDSVVNIWYYASLNEPRGATADQLIKYLYSVNLSVRGKTYKSVKHAWHAAMSVANPEDTVLVFGSFKTVAHVIKAI